MGGFKCDHLLKKKDEGQSNGDKDSNFDKTSVEAQNFLDSSVDGSDRDYERGIWAHKLEFILSVIGYSVGVGNLWRFPYLVMQNGGGAFLIPFFFFLVLCGLPLFYLELSLGQFSGISCIFVWKFCPLFKGVGYMMLVVSFVYCWYYIMVMVWVMVFLVNSFLPNLPWTRCDQEWNTPNCIAGLGKLRQWCEGDNCTVANMTMVPQNQTLGMSMTASKQFWNNYVLHKSNGLEEFGHIQWHLAIPLTVAWIVVFLCLMKGIKTIGKVVYVTALLPYVLLTVFLIRGLTLPGAADGILYYIKPDFSRLAHGQVWLQAAVQVFYSLGPAWGGLITMSSYNKFNNNCLRDAFLCCAADGFTSFYGGFVIFSVIGYLAKEAGLEIKDVATSGPGLALVVYPEAISMLPIPQLWAAMFFLMLICLGIDSQFGVFETLSCGLTDMWPHLRKKKILITGIICVVLLLLDLPFTMNSGIYLYQLVDWYFAAFCVLIISFLECVLIAWVYGAEKFCLDIKLMLGRYPPVFFRICWCFITPLILLVTFFIMCYQYEPPAMDGYEYPYIAKLFGNILALVPVIPLPITMVYEIYNAKGTLRERVSYLLKPAADWGPHLSQYKAGYKNQDESSHSLLDTVKQNLLGASETSL